MRKREFPTLPLDPEGIIGVPIEATVQPRRLIVIRLHAFGDTVITLPALAALRERLPDSRLEVVTDVRSASLFEARSEPDRVWRIDTRQPRLPRALALSRLADAMRAEPIDAVIDLQRSSWSRALTQLLRPPAWVGFDRYAPRTALDRYLEAIAWIGLGRLEPVYEGPTRLRGKVREEARALLQSAGRRAEQRLVCLNPAGSWTTKHWPLDRYIELGRRLQAEGCQILLLGAGALLPRLALLSSELGAQTLDLTGRTTPDLALALVAQSALVISDDSGLMHMAWTQGIPTVAIFGSSRRVWSRPEGAHSTGFYSEDLSCGACMQPECARGDCFCLTRITVEDVLKAARGLLRQATRPAP